MKQNAKKRNDLLLLARIDSVYEELTKAEKKIADYIKENPEEIAELSAQELGRRTQTGAATVVRFCRDCGFDGLTEMKMSLKRENISLDAVEDLDIYPEDSVAIIKQKVLSYHMHCIEQIMSDWNEESLEQAVNAILKANRILVSGVGYSKATSILLYNALNLQEFNVQRYDDSVDELDYLVRMKKGDVLIGFSYTGRFKATVDLFQLAKERGVTTIAIQGMPGGALADVSDICVRSCVNANEVFFGGRNNVIGDTAMVEILTTVLANKRATYHKHQRLLRDALESYRYKKD
ncbi:MAG: MurR/RpiR family transcriptional regulator [Dorea sp.]|nr:MurR/RpiR family transcriptional regulator [Dorea sp.]